MSREKIVNLPSALVGLIAFFVAVRLAQDAFSESVNEWILLHFAFVPLLFVELIAPNLVTPHAAALSDVYSGQLEGLSSAAREAIASPLTYAFLHANWTHLAVNGLTLAAFGAPLARRFGPLRFLGFFAVTAMAGALAHFIAHPFDAVPVVGASASISGVIAALARFAFHDDSVLSGGALAAQDAPAATLRETLRDRRTVVFLASWLLANLLFGVVAPPPAGVGAIAWEAHLGGFLAGLTLFGWFDRALVRSARD